MAQIIAVHSFRGGTGKSNTTANIAAVMAGDGKRVGIVDTDIQSPGIHILFGLKGDDITNSLNDYLWHGLEIDKAALDVTPLQGQALSGRIFLIPSSTKAGEITRVLRQGYDAQKLIQGLRRLVDSLKLDVLLIDSHPGLNEETLLSLVIAQTLVVVMRPDQQDYEGTGITVKVARQLKVPRMLIVVNKTPPELEAEAVKTKVEQIYGCEVGAVLHHSNEMMSLASAGIFALHYPTHPMTALYREIASKLTENAEQA